MKIDELIVAIRNRDLVLPEFQREYVWSKDQAKQLIVSLFREYPIGGLLFWKTNDPPELKNLPSLPTKLGTVQVMLDGQQRLTTLYMLMTGDIPPYYTEKDIEYDPRDLYFNLDNCEFQYYQASRMKGNPLWHRVVDCFGKADSPINVFQIASQTAQVDQSDPFALAQKYNANLNRLQNVSSMSLPEQLIPPHATMDEAIDIFDRVNSQGTKLTDAELALTHITGKWPTARKEFKAKITQFKHRGFEFDLSFMTRALTGVVVKRALFETIHDMDRNALQAGWRQLQNILDYLVKALPAQANIHSTSDLNTYNVLIPWIVYLSQNGGTFQSSKDFSQAIHWLYAASIWARYTAQTDQRLEHDVTIVKRESSPWDSLRSQIVDQRGRIEVKDVDFEGRGAQHPLYHMVQILAKAHSAVDWFNGLPLTSGTGTGSYSMQSHHIFPQALLYAPNRYSPDNHLHRKIINEIANRAFLTTATNMSIGASLPEVYLPEVEQKYPGALASQFVPMDPNLWKLDRFEDFLAARREIIARKLNETMNALISEPVTTKEKSLVELIAMGESGNLEFKSSLQWDIVQSQMNKALRHSVLKTIAAFLNTEGGTLLIGVEDTGSILGLDNDLATAGRSRDSYHQLLYAQINDRIGTIYAPLVKARFESVDGKDVCVVDVDRAADPAYLEGPKGSEFFIRAGNTTRALEVSEAVAYVQQHWE